MSVQNKFKEGPWVFGGAAVQLNGLGNCTMNPGCKEVSVRGAGQITRSFIALSMIESVVTGSTTDLSTALGSLGMGANGGWVPVNSAATATSLSIYGTEAAAFGTVGGSSTHFKNVINNALVTGKSLSASQGGNASLSLSVDCIWDGTNLPFAYATGVSIPTVPVVNQLFTLGPVKPNGTQIPGCTNLEIDFGLTVKKESSDGETYPTYVYIEAYNPKITMTFTDASIISTIGLLGTTQGATTSTFYFTARQQGATNYANASTQHIKVAMNANQGMFWGQDASFQPDTGECKIVGYPIVGNSAVLTFSTGVAIT